MAKQKLEEWGELELEELLDSLMEADTEDLEEDKDIEFRRSDPKKTK